MTAAASGLMAGVAASLAANGFSQVAITYRDTPPDATLAAIESAGARASAQRVDFLDDPDIIAAELHRLAERSGPFDTLVHGVGPIAVKRFTRATLVDYRELFDGNVRSAVLTAQAVLPQMRAAGFGRIVFFGALGAEQTRAYRGFSLYQAAKSALVAFAKTLAIEEAGAGITVNVVTPGDIRDKTIGREAARTLPARNPRGRPGSVDDIASAVRFLVDAEHDFVTGAVLEVSGGLTQADERNET